VGAAGTSSSHSLTGPFGAIAADMQRGAVLAVEEVNARGGVLDGRPVEVLIRDDQLTPAVGAQRTKELIENDRVRGDWGYFDVVQKIPASEDLDRTCAEKGLA
jgi:ABC-type branched-subunit amino acid transport system substrate-binding protein